MIGKAPGKLPDDPGGLLDPLEQDDAGIRADRPPVEPSNQRTSILCLQDDGLGCTLCRHQKAPSFCCQLLLDKRLIADKGAFFNTICEKCGLAILLVAAVALLLGGTLYAPWIARLMGEQKARTT